VNEEAGGEPLALVWFGGFPAMTMTDQLSSSTTMLAQDDVSWKTRLGRPGYVLMT
jgi:hypothetical protein